MRWPRLLHLLVAMTRSWASTRSRRTDDRFVRRKRLSLQALGWHPDLNDGVRMGTRPFAAAEIFRKKKKIMWDKDCGKEPRWEKAEYPWFWSGCTFTSDRVNDIHLTRDQKEKERKP